MVHENDSKKKNPDERSGDAASYLKACSTPYLPLNKYEISRDVIEMIPYDIAKKYCVIPVERIGNIISIVMENPLDEEAVKAVEKITGCVVRKFIGTHSEILSALSNYKETTPELPEPTERKEDFEKIGKEYELPDSSTMFDISNLPRDERIERRGAFRFKCKLGIHFPENKDYVKSETTDISYNGIAFKSAKPIPVGKYLNISIDLQGSVFPRPIALLFCVGRCTKMASGDFCIGGNILETSDEDIEQIIRYSISHIPSNMRSDKNLYNKLERRKSIRFKTDIKLWLPVGCSYEETMAEDINSYGISFKSKTPIPLGSYVPLQLEPPKEVKEHPLVRLIEVARITKIQGGYFSIGAKWVKTQRSDMERIIRYAGRHNNKDNAK